MRKAKNKDEEGKRKNRMPVCMQQGRGHPARRDEKHETNIGKWWENYF
jgi:hypothetical protein